MDNNRGQQQRTTTGDLRCKGYGRYGKGTSAEEDTGGTTEGLNSKGFWRHDKGPSAEEDTGGVTEDNNRGPQLQRILEIRQRTISRRGYWRYNMT